MNKKSLKNEQEIDNKNKWMGNESEMNQTSIGMTIENIE